MTILKLNMRRRRKFKVVILILYGLNLVDRYCKEGISIKNTLLIFY